MSGSEKSSEKAEKAGVKAPAAGGETFALSRSASHMLHRAQQFASEAFIRAHAAESLTFRQFTVLAAVSETPGASQSDLVRATGIDRSTLADLIGRMEKKNLLTREVSKADSRAKSVKVTNKGLRKLSEAAPLAMVADKVVLDALPKAKQKIFLDLLSALQAAAEAATDSEPPMEKRAAKKAEKKVSKTGKKRAKR